MNKDKVDFYGYPATKDYDAFLRKMRDYYGCDNCQYEGQNGCGSWQLGGWEFNGDKPERAEGWYCLKSFKDNKIDHYQDASEAYRLLKNPATDELTARGLVEVAKTAALVSIADSLRKYTVIQNANVLSSKRAHEEPEGVE